MSHNPVFAMDSKACYCLTSSLAARLVRVNTKGYDVKRFVSEFFYTETYSNLCTSVDSKHQNINIAGN